MTTSPSARQQSRTSPAHVSTAGCRYRPRGDHQKPISAGCCRLRVHCSPSEHCRLKRTCPTSSRHRLRARLHRVRPPTRLSALTLLPGGRSGLRGLADRSADRADLRHRNLDRLALLRPRLLGGCLRRILLARRLSRFDAAPCLQSIRHSAMPSGLRSQHPSRGALGLQLGSKRMPDDAPEAWQRSGEFRDPGQLRRRRKRGRELGFGVVGHRVSNSSDRHQANAAAEYAMVITTLTTARARRRSLRASA